MLSRLQQKMEFRNAWKDVLLYESLYLVHLIVILLSQIDLCTVLALKKEGLLA